MRQSPWPLAAAFAIAAPFITAGCSDRAPATPQVTINGHTWTVDLAMTQKQRFTGLSGRQVIPNGYGMLFVYPKPRDMIFCMRGCPVPIDIAFIDSKMRVIKIHQMQVEPDLEENEMYLSGGPAQFALEVAGGTLEQAGVKEGDAVTISCDMPSPAKAEDEP